MYIECFISVCIVAELDIFADVVHQQYYELVAECDQPADNSGSTGVMCMVMEVT